MQQCFNIFVKHEFAITNTGNEQHVAHVRRRKIEGRKEEGEDKGEEGGGRRKEAGCQAGRQRIQLMRSKYSEG